MNGRLAMTSVLLLVACNTNPGKPSNDKKVAWQRGHTTSSDGAEFSILCLSGEWNITVHTVERLVPPDAERQWVNRDVTYQFDGDPVERTKGTLNENRLDFEQSDEGSTVSLNYGQDVAAGLMKHHKTLVISTKDGSGRDKRWVFDVEGSTDDIPNDNGPLACPMIGNAKAGV